MFNTISISGHLTKDAELTYSKKNNTPCLSFSIAWNSYRKVGEEWQSDAHYFDVQLYGTKCDKLKTKLLKGLPVAVSGSLRQSRWEKDGKNYSKIYILADDVMEGVRTDPDDPNYILKKAGPVAPPPPEEKTSTMDTVDYDNQLFPEDIPF